MIATRYGYCKRFTNYTCKTGSTDRARCTNEQCQWTWVEKPEWLGTARPPNPQHQTHESQCIALGIEALFLERQLHDLAPSHSAYDSWMDSTAARFDTENGTCHLLKVDHISGAKNVWAILHSPSSPAVRNAINEASLHATDAQQYQSQQRV